MNSQLILLMLGSLIVLLLGAILMLLGRYPPEKSTTKFDRPDQR